MLNAKGVLLHTTYNLLKASFWLVCTYVLWSKETSLRGVVFKTKKNHFYLEYRSHCINSHSLLEHAIDTHYSTTGGPGLTRILGPGKYCFTQISAC